MIQVTPHMRILVAREPLNFRCGIDGTVAHCRRVLEEDPMRGALFCFFNRRATMVRILVYDGQGFWLLTKRLSTGHFHAWRGAPTDPSSQAILAHQLQTLVAAGDWTQLACAPMFRKIA
jgi:transposase